MAISHQDHGTGIGSVRRGDVLGALGEAKSRATETLTSAKPKPSLEREGLISLLIPIDPGSIRLLLRRLNLGVLATEALNAAGGVHQLLLAGEERMAIRANFYPDVALMGR